MVYNYTYTHVHGIMYYSAVAVGMTVDIGLLISKHTAVTHVHNYVVYTYRQL